MARRYKDGQRVRVSEPDNLCYGYVGNVIHLHDTTETKQRPHWYYLVEVAPGPRISVPLRLTFREEHLSDAT